ncbi:cAMP-independent regulatory protein pac2 [Exophiala dermatitidis]
METYNGHVRTPADAIILFEACRLGILPRVQRRLSEKERQSIRSGSVFVWDEREAGMRRWTDGKSWSASRVSGSFLTYREMEGKRGGQTFPSNANKGTKTPESTAEDPSQNGEAEDGPDGYRYKPDGLMKQSFSITTSQGQHLHLISYYSRSHPTAQVLRQPSTDPNLAHVVPAKGLYPESTINDQSSVPAVTRSPMVGVPSYVVSPSTPGYHRPTPANPHPYLPPGYIPHPTYIYPISPIHTPPGHYPLQHYASLPPGVSLPPGAPLPPGLPPLPYGHAPYPPPHALALHHAPPSSYDQRPLRNTDSRSPGPAPLPPATSAQGSSAPHNTTQPPPTQQQANSSVSATAPASTAEPGTENPASSNQVDPALANSTNGGGGQPNANTPRAEQGQSEPRPAETAGVGASQAPTITSLVHNITTSLPPTEKVHGGSEVNRQGSTSPGGTKNGAPPQDIPSEKLGFREDKRALSKLDRVFARV